MDLIRKFLSRIRSKRAESLPVRASIRIPTPFGDVTESARRQAALNMAADPVLFLKVESAVIKECGGDVERGKVECRRRYPEAYDA